MIKKTRLAVLMIFVTAAALSLSGAVHSFCTSDANEMHCHNGDFNRCTYEFGREEVEPGPPGCTYDSFQTDGMCNGTIIIYNCPGGLFLDSYLCECE